MYMTDYGVFKLLETIILSSDGQLCQNLFGNDNFYENNPMQTNRLGEKKKIRHPTDMAPLQPLLNVSLFLV